MEVIKCSNGRCQDAVLFWNSYFASVDEVDNNLDNDKLNAWKHNCVMQWLTAAIQSLFKHRTCSGQHCTVCFDQSVISNYQRVTQVARFLELK